MMLQSLTIHGTSDLRGAMRNQVSCSQCQIERLHWCWSWEKLHLDLVRSPVRRMFSESEWPKAVWRTQSFWGYKGSVQQLWDFVISLFSSPRSLFNIGKTELIYFFFLSGEHARIRSKCLHNCYRRADERKTAQIYCSGAGILSTLVGYGSLGYTEAAGKLH